MILNLVKSLSKLFASNMTKFDHTLTRSLLYLMNVVTIYLLYPSLQLASIFESHMQFLRANDM